MGSGEQANGKPIKAVSHNLSRRKDRDRAGRLTFQPGPDVPEHHGALPGSMHRCLQAVLTFLHSIRRAIEFVTFS